LDVLVPSAPFTIDVTPPGSTQKLECTWYILLLPPTFLLLLLVVVVVVVLLFAQEVDFDTDSDS